MSKSKAQDCHDFRRKIRNPSQLYLLRKLSEKWCMDMSDICWQFITEGLKREKNKMDEIEEIRNT